MSLYLCTLVANTINIGTPSPKLNLILNLNKKGYVIKKNKLYHMTIFDVYNMEKNHLCLILTQLVVQVLINIYIW